jgi:hypothetical protein
MTSIGRTEMTEINYLHDDCCKKRFIVAVVEKWEVG